VKSHTAIGFANSLINIIKMQVLLNIINLYTVSDFGTPICSIWGGGIEYCYRICEQPHTYHPKVQVLRNEINSYTMIYSKRFEAPQQIPQIASGIYVNLF